MRLHICEGDGPSSEHAVPTKYHGGRRSRPSPGPRGVDERFAEEYV